MKSGAHQAEVLKYARDTVDNPGICELTRLSCKRFLDDLDSGRWDWDPFLAEWCIGIITGMFCFKSGERLDGTPLRGKPMELMPWHLFSIYNLCGFYQPGIQIRRFTEGDIFNPRKTVKTTFADALLNALEWYYRMSGPAAKTVAGSLKQGIGGFEWQTYNYKRLGLIADGNPPGKLQLLNSSLGHSIKGDFWGGSIDMETLAFKPDLFDSFNASFVHLDELELYKNAIPYTRLRDAMKAYTHKLILVTFTAGDNATGFAARHHDWMEGILRGTITGPEADRTFIFMAEAEKGPDGSVDYTNPLVHKSCNPGYGITIRPDDMQAAANQAKSNPDTRKEFLTRSLNVFVGSIKAYFDIEEFRRSDGHYSWSPKEASKLVRAWYGGADLSKLHDLTAAAIVGEIPAERVSCPNWTPPEDVLCILPHAWFPITAAREKADEDQIPLFGWAEDGWLDMPNEPSMDPTEPVKQFLKWRQEGYKIESVGHDRKFARKYCQAMAKAGFRIKDQPQLYMLKSEGFRYIEHKAKVGCLYYFHAEPFEYCTSNIRAVEKVDDAVQYEKIDDHSRIDIFDAADFATVRMLIETDRGRSLDEWLRGGKKED